MRTGHVKRIRALREEDAVSPVIATILMVAITVVLAGTLYVWAANLAESNTDGDLELYTFDSNDAAGSPSMATDDNLAITTMTQGESIGWASLAVSVSVDGAAAVQCALPGQTDGACIVVESETNDGGIWSMGEDITIQENGVDLCNAALCDLSITITNVRAGKSLGTTTTVSEQGGSLVALPRMATQNIGADGGSISVQGATINIPAGALAADTELTFEALTAADVNDQDVSGYDIPTTFLKLTPHGTTFSQPVTVTIAATSGMPDNPTIYTKADDNAEWEEFTDQISVSGNTISFQIYSFSYYFGTNATPDDLPRISYWWGKVNQHVENSQWTTDPDGSSGANLDMLQYCQKWYPDTVSVVELPEREAIVFYNAGNNGYFPTIKPVFECVQPDNGTGGGSGGGDPNACNVDADCMAGGYCLNGACVYNDQDMDGIPDSQDNCPANANVDQVDTDGDGVGDACDSTPFGPMTTYYRDADSDTYGDPTQTTESYNQPAGYVTNADDCDDTDPNLNLANCPPQGYGVVTWGSSSWGGDSSAVANELSSGVVEVVMAVAGGAAIKTDGSAVSWGHIATSDIPFNQLSSDVVSLQHTEFAFAALKSDGSVVTWGNSNFGADSSSVSSSLSSGVIEIFSTQKAFAALKSDGSVVTWGSPNYGGDSSSVSGISNGISEIYSSEAAFAALSLDGSVATWGSSSYGGDSSSFGYTNVIEIYPNNGAFAALLSNGQVKAWGNSNYGGNPSSTILNQLSTGVSEIYSTEAAFAAVKNDGSVVTWGNSGYGADSSSVSSSLSSGVIEIFSTQTAFSALKSDGSVVTWGVSGGHDSSSVSTQLSSGVVNIFSNSKSFVALKSDGSLVTWGNSGHGGDSSSVSNQISSGVIDVASTLYMHAALKSDGSVVTWGVDYSPSSTSSVSQQLSSGIVSIVGNTWAFAALDSDGANVPADGTACDDGDPSTTGDVYVNGVCQGTPSNSPPVVSGLTFDSTSSGIFTYTTHNCLFTVSDADGDAVTTTINWYADGVQIGTGSSITLNLGIISVGQNLQCEVTPNDGTVDGQTVITPINANSVVQNSSPSISSVVIGYSTQQHTSGTFAGDQLTCTPSGGSDLDGDALTYAYTWYVNGVSHSTTQNLDTTGMSSGDVVYCSIVANDGTDDSAVVNSASTTVYTIHNINIQNMAFGESVASTNGEAVAWGDVDGDGDLDLAIGVQNAPNKLYLNNGNSLDITPIWTSGDSFSTNSIDWGDIDGDGDLDLAIGNIGGENQVFLNTGTTLAATPAWTSSNSVMTFGIKWADIDGDGDLDLAVANVNSPNEVYLNDGTTLATTPAWTSANAVASYEVEFGDINGDGNYDLIFGNNGPNQVYFGTGTTPYFPSTPDWTSSNSLSSQGIEIGDINMDGNLDLVVGNNNNNLELYLNTGSTLEATPSWIMLEQNDTRDIAIGDMDGDGDLDLAVANNGNPNTLFINYITTNGYTYGSGPDWISSNALNSHGVAWADIDGDGDEDLAVANFQDKPEIYTSTGATLSSTDTWSNTVTVVVGDLIIWTNLDSMGHTVTEDGNTPSFDSGVITNGQTYSLSFGYAAAGNIYTYHCTPHPSMTGTIIVQ